MTQKSDYNITIYFVTSCYDLNTRHVIYVTYAEIDSSINYLLPTVKKL